MRFERIVALLTGVVIVFFILYLVYRNEPFADENLVVTLRIVLSLAVGVLGATIPGVLNIEYNLKGLVIRATGALGLFLIAFFATPEVKPLNLGSLDGELIKVRDLVDKNYLSEADRAIDGLIEKYPNNSKVLNTKGSLCVRSSDYVCALEYFKSAVDNSQGQQDKSNYLKNLGFAQTANEDYAGAVETYKDILEADKSKEKSEAALYNLAVALTHAGNTDDARKHLEKMVKKINGADYRAAAQYYMGVTRLVEQPPELDKAIRRFQKSVLY